MDAKHMQQLTELGLKVKAKIATKENDALRTRVAETKALARKIATDQMKPALKSIEEAARAGDRCDCIHVGEDSELISFVSEYLAEDLKIKGFVVEFKCTKHEPIGSDPYRWDTFIDVDLIVRW